jgi:hypothetical protein
MSKRVFGSPDIVAGIQRSTSAAKHYLLRLKLADGVSRTLESAISSFDDEAREALWVRPVKISIPWPQPRVVCRPQMCTPVKPFLALPARS